MGEATYYIAAKCATEQDAEVLLDKFRALNAEGIKAYNWWQAHRSQTSKAFWPVFRAQFPLVADYLDRDHGSITDSQNGLAGLLDFIDEDDGQLYCENEYLYGNGTVWHCADWTPLTHWLTRHGAESTSWLSDEETEVNYFSLLRQKL